MVLLYWPSLTFTKILYAHKDDSFAFVGREKLILVNKDTEYLRLLNCTYYFIADIRKLCTVLTFISVGFLGVHFTVKEAGVKITPCLKLVKFMLENLNLVRSYTQIYSLRKYKFYYQDLLNSANVSVAFLFFNKKISILSQK